MVFYQPLVSASDEEDSDVIYTGFIPYSDTVHVDDLDDCIYIPSSPPSLSRSTSLRNEWIAEYDADGNFVDMFHIEYFPLSP